MEPSRYYYSKFQTWSMILPLGAIEMYILYSTVSLLLDKLFIGVALISVVLISMTFLVIKTGWKFLIPAIKNEIAIELDEDKIQYNVGNWELYWKEISQTDWASNGMKLTLKNGDEIYISFQYIEHPWDVIRDNINEYFENA